MITHLKNIAVALLGIGWLSAIHAADDVAYHWEPAGWGGGGYYWSAVFHPTKDGVIYHGQDTGGVAKTTDHGMNWKMIVKGLTDLGIFSLAVDRCNPETVYAGTGSGLHKSVDGGEHWQFLPKTGPKDLRITAERGRSVRAIAVDPSNGNNVYAATPGGKIYKSTDGGMTWQAVYETAGPASEDYANLLRVQYGKVNAEYFGGVWCSFSFPQDAKADACVGIGLSMKGDKGNQDKYIAMIKTSSGASYISRDLGDAFKGEQYQDVVLKAQDFVLDSGYAKKNPDAPAVPDLSTVTRMDISCNGAMQNASNIAIGRFFFAIAGANGAAPTLKTVRDFKADKTVQTYGNIRLVANGDTPKTPTVSSVAVAVKDPSLVVAATEEAGVVLSEDGGKTWRELGTPKNATSAVFADTDPNIMFASFRKDGVWKSSDKGRTWAASSVGIPDNVDLREVVVSPANALDVYCIGGAAACLSNDGGKTWKKMDGMFVDLEGDPTRHYNGDNPKTAIIRTQNIAINPQNPKELYIACDWRPCWSGDGGITWYERCRGSDICCNTDIRFTKGRVYSSAMDVGALVSENNGKSWRQLWPSKYIASESGHCWRIAVNTVDGVDHIVTGFSPWSNSPKTNVVIVSDDGGKTHQVTRNGLLDYVPTKNTMWENGFIRALAADPANPSILYAGIDGDPEPGKPGGGIFKSEDGGHTWKQLANQPGSRRMFFGLAVDPTDSRRIVWGACNERGGVWISDDGGETWRHAFKNDTWIWNVMVAKDGRIYASGANLWRSSDHGKTWAQLTQFQGRKIQGFELDPRDSKTVWIAAGGRSRITDCGIYKTTDDGVTWQDITGDNPSRAPQVLRFNPETNELWSGCVGLYKIKQ